MNKGILMESGLYNLIEKIDRDIMMLKNSVKNDFKRASLDKLQINPSYIVPVDDSRIDIIDNDLYEINRNNITDNVEFITEMNKMNTVNSDLIKKLRTKDEEIMTLNKKINNMETELSKQIEDSSFYIKTIDEYSRNYNEQYTEMNELNNNMEKYKNEIRKLEENIKENEKLNEKNREQYDKLVKVMEELNTEKQNFNELLKGVKILLKKGLNKKTQNEINNLIIMINNSNNKKKYENVIPLLETINKLINEKMMMDDKAKLLKEEQNKYKKYSEYIELIENIKSVFGIKLNEKLPPKEIREQILKQLFLKFYYANDIFEKIIEKFNAKKSEKIKLIEKYKENYGTVSKLIKNYKPELKKQREQKEEPIIKRKEEKPVIKQKEKKSDIFPIIEEKEKKSNIFPIIDERKEKPQWWIPKQEEKEEEMPELFVEEERKGIPKFGTKVEEGECVITEKTKEEMINYLKDYKKIMEDIYKKYSLITKLVAVQIYDVKKDNKDEVIQNVIYLIQTGMKNDIELIREFQTFLHLYEHFYNNVEYSGD